ncbi:MAG: nuclear transport factor 2 family protein [Chryseobacterium sp.]|uniref:nuclear transport factor 2 family protein n=1 Tax=Chryseobacterium carnipullorum TaxID=1124835 RepID=UPI0009142E0E|nr:nuclear transport factor 2 family protein [Chryseobacterium carnipullorum]MDN5396001.1 nuclear transport factor 2 family protein [Chryseobacterium sp.]MDN5478126.1 nuclear transport factor 2 family protein [Chryseobacterium sp.]SHL96884.1 hypothetical protein SAMN05444360_106168 [Chryseobacterium carnipullorum]
MDLRRRQSAFGKNDIRGYMADTYKKPPKFDVEYLIEKGDYMTAVGTISLLEENGWVAYDYCDVWRFENGLMAELKAFVIRK